MTLPPGKQKSEILAVRVDPKLKFTAQLAARVLKMRGVSTFGRYAVDQQLKGVDMNTKSTALMTVDIPSLAMKEEELVSVLQTSIYPGATVPAIKMVIGYCQAQKLDPMLKPVHLVPMSVKVPRQQGDTRDQYEWRDVVMPGIGLYRTIAARTGEYAGCSEPEFGPMQTLQVGDFKMEYPEWCRVTVTRVVDGRPCEFSAKEYWIENYATQKKDSEVPNSMWKKRKYGQIAKCAEAQALRKAFPEVGAQPTADEMVGKEVYDDGTTIDNSTGRVVEQPTSKKSASAEPAAQSTGPAHHKESAEESTQGKKKKGKPVTEGMVKTIRRAMSEKACSDLDIQLGLNVGLNEQGNPMNGWSLADLTTDDVNNVLDFIAEFGQSK
jgi:phage recombination protein Bet